MEALIHAANVIYLVSYGMRDILWLRLFTVAAAICLIFYFYLRPDPLMVPIYWNLIFIALNVFWISRLLYERRPVTLTKDEQDLCTLVFGTITPREMTNLLKIGTWEVAKADECFVAAGSRLDTLGEGQCFGEMGYLARAERTASIVALEDVTLLRISSELMEGTSTASRLRFNQAFVQTLIERLARTSEALAARMN